MSTYAHSWQSCDRPNIWPDTLNNVAPWLKVLEQARPGLTGLGSARPVDVGIQIMISDEVRKLVLLCDVCIHMSVCISNTCIYVYMDVCACCGCVYSCGCVISLCSMKCGQMKWLMKSIHFVGEKCNFLSFMILLGIFCLLENKNEISSISPPLSLPYKLKEAHWYGWSVGIRRFDFTACILFWPLFNCNNTSFSWADNCKCLIELYWTKYRAAISKSQSMQQHSHTAKSTFTISVAFNYKCTLFSMLC